MAAIDGRRRPGLLAALVLPAVLVGVLFQAGQIGVGAFPEEIGFRGMRRGATAEQTIGVINDSDLPRILEVAVTGEAGPWLTLASAEGGDAAGVVAPGGRRFLTVTVAVPDDAANGEYRAAVELLSRRSDDDDGGSDVGITLEIPVTVTVTGTQSVEGAILGVTASDTEVGVPLRFVAQLDNRSNVTVSPVLTVELFRDGEAVDAVDLEAGAVPEGVSDVSGEWPTDGRQPGEYVVRVSASFAGESLGSGSASFTLFDRGHFTRSISVLAIRLANQPGPGGVAEVELDFINTGVIEATATFAAELTKDGRRLEEQRSRPLVVGAGGEATLRVFFPVEEGTYLVAGRVVFDGGETPAETLVFRVGEPEGFPAASVLPWIGGIALLALCVVAVVRIVRRRREYYSPPRPGHPRVG